jgi:hypothetical protein
MGNGISSQQWFNVVVPYGLILCLVTFGLMRRFERLGFFATLYLVVVPLPVAFAYLVPMLGGTWDLGRVVLLVGWLTAACGAMCAELVRYEERKRNREEELRAMREGYRRYQDGSTEKYG